MDGEKPATITASPSIPGANISLYLGLSVRQIGRSPCNNSLPRSFEAAAEDQLVHQEVYSDTKCSLPPHTRSTFLMVFSPDGKLVASTHGDHCVYVCDVATGACIRTLSGHPRTPWCLAFHPTCSQLLASGCLGGQVRVWDLSGGSEMWCAEEQTVIASLAFHPSSDRLLVIATYNELLFWDWSKPRPFVKCSTRSDKEKVRFVTFDPLGQKLITGIANRWIPPSQWDQQGTTTGTSTFYSRPSTSAAQAGNREFLQNLDMQDRASTLASGSNSVNTAASGSRAATWEWTTPFSNLLQEYESLVQRCRQRLGSDRPGSQTGTSSGTASSSSSSTTGSMANQAASSSTGNNETSTTLAQGTASRATTITTFSNRVDRGTNTQDSITPTNLGGSLNPSVSLSSLGMRSNQSNRINSYVQCIANLEDPVATTNIERLRNPLTLETSRLPASNAPSTSVSSSSNSQASGLTIPCSVNLGERVSEDGLRRLREVWRAGIDSATASTSRDINSPRETNRESGTAFMRPRRRRRFPHSSFEPRRETKRLRTNCETQRKEPNSANKESKATTKEPSAPSASASSSATVNPIPPVQEAASSSRSSSIYDNPQPGTSQSGTEPEVFIVLSDTDSSSDETNTMAPRVPLIDLTEERQASAYLSRLQLERQIRIIRLLNTPFRRSHPRMPGFLQTSQQSAFRPQTPRGSGSPRGTRGAPNQRSTPTVPRFLRASADLGVRYAIRMLSRHIDMMERRCRARLEILQLEQIRRLWEEFMTQLTSLNSSLSRNSEHREDTNETQEERPESTDASLWTRRESDPEALGEVVAGPSESISQPNDGPGPSSLPTVDLEDREAEAAIEEAYQQISNDPGLEDEEMILLESSLSSSNASVDVNASVSNNQESPSVAIFPENSSRASLSGQVPEDRPVEASSQSTENSLRVDYPWEEGTSDTSNQRSEPSASSGSTSARSEGISRNSSDTSEEYQNTLLRANQIAVLRRLLTLLDRNEFPFDADASTRDTTSNSGARPATATPSREVPRNRDLSGRPPRSGRGSPTEFLEELRSIQQSIVQRYDQMSMEIPSQEAMQRDLDRIVNLEAAVRERLRLSEDNFERLNRESNNTYPPSQPRTPGSPWSRENPLHRRRVDGDPSLVIWNSDLPRSALDDFSPSTGTSAFPRLSQSYFFRPPPEPPLVPPDERTDAHRDGGSNEEWHNNANLLQSTRRQAWRVLGLMVRHVRQHIELHQLERYSEGSSLQAHLQQLLSLLHRALELTDTLLTQMLATRREMEQQWRVRVRTGPSDRNQRQFRHLWHPLERVDYFPATNATTFSHTLAAWRDRESAAFGMYAQEMHRRGLYDTDPAVVNHLIQHFQRRTPEPGAPTETPEVPEVSQPTVEENGVNSDRSMQLRQRLGGLWSCRRNPGEVQRPRSSSNTTSSQGAASSSTSSATNNRVTPGVSEPSSQAESRTSYYPPPYFPRVVRVGSNPRVRQAGVRNEEGSSNTNNIPPNPQPSLYDNIRSRYNRVCTILDRLTQLDPSPQFRAWADNLRRLLEMPQRYFEVEDERQRSERRQSAFNVPSVRVNDIPLPDSAINNQAPRGPSQPTSPPLWTRRRPEEEAGPRQRSRSPSPVLGRNRAGAWRSWMYYPRNRGVPNSARDLFGASHQATMEGVRGGATASCPTTLTHRIQCWPFLEGDVPPDISNPQRHLVVASCRINNDASVDVSRDGRLLVALVPSPRPGGHSKLGIYSLETSTLGQMLFSTPLEQSPVSVSLSPSSRYLLVGLATKRFLTARGESSPAAQVFRLPWEKGAGKDRDTAVVLDASRFIYQTSETGYVSINCIRWAPVSGQGMVYGTNTGNLGILR